jgi:hypothetical protein
VINSVIRGCEGRESRRGVSFDHHSVRTLEVRQRVISFLKEIWLWDYRVILFQSII